MNFESVWIRQQWSRQRTFLVDWTFLALLAVTFAPWPVSSVMPFLAVIFASGIGQSLGGYPTLSGTWEFLLTRSISRERFLRAQFVAALVPIAIFSLAGFVADQLHLRYLIASLFVPALSAPAPAGPWIHHVAGFFVAAHVMAHVFIFALREKRPEALAGAGLRLGGMFSALVTLGAFAFLGSLAVYAVMTRRMSPYEFREVSIDASVGAIPAVVAAILCVLEYVFARSSLRRREITGDVVAVQAGRVATSRGAWAAILLVVLLLGLIAFLMLRSASPGRRTMSYSLFDRNPPPSVAPSGK